MSAPARRPGGLKGKIKTAPDFDTLPEEILAEMESEHPGAAAHPRGTLGEFLAGIAPENQPEPFADGPRGEELLYAGMVAA